MHFVLFDAHHGHDKVNDPATAIDIFRDRGARTDHADTSGLLPHN
jgi:hypothetical protein